MSAAVERIRIDVWLWRARLCKTRTAAAELVGAGAVRLIRAGQGRVIAKPGEAVGAGDGLSLAVGGRLRSLTIRACGARRGPATEARTLYDEVSDSDTGET
jgi:ribosome-associated heat shock protein Hsp15